QRFLEMYRLSPEVVRPGMPFIDALRHSAERGNLPLSQVDDHMRRRTELMARGEPFRMLRQMSNGLTYALSSRPIQGGGWVTLCEDVTDRQRKEYDLRLQFERFDQAVNHMSHGLVAIDAEHRIVLFNSLFIEMYGLSEDFLKVGVSMQDVLAHVA